MLAGDELREVAVALRVAAVEAQLVDAEVGMRAVKSPMAPEAREISSMTTAWAR